MRQTRLFDIEPPPLTGLGAIRAGFRKLDKAIQRRPRSEPRRGILTFQADFAEPLAADGAAPVCKIKQTVHVLIENDGHDWLIVIEGRRLSEHHNNRTRYAVRRFFKHTAAMRHVEKLFGRQLTAWRPIPRKENAKTTTPRAPRRP